MHQSLKRFALLAAMSVGVITGCTAAHAEEEGKEVKVKLNECPPAVQATLAKEAKGAKKPIESVDKETAKDGKVIYEADVVLEDGKNYEIQVDADGKLVSKKIDNEENEKK